ncbi:MAG: ribosomal protein S18-alanine N-acetyltransferase [Gemmatimonadaceae bacterium]
MADNDADAIETPPAVAPFAPFALRRAVASDVAAIAALEKAAFTDPWSAAEFATLLNSRHGIFLVALDTVGRALAGYTIITTVLDEAEVLNLAVAPSLRGRGVGGLLLDAATSAASARGASSVFLEVRESNAAARALYASRGFTEVSRRRRYYVRPVEDALVLRGAAQR